MTTSSDFPSTIQDPLHREIDFITSGVARNLYAVGKSTHGAMSPATSAVLRNMLIQRMGREGYAADVFPGKVVRKIFLTNVRVGQRGRKVILNCMTFQNLKIKSLEPWIGGVVKHNKIVP